MVNAPPSVVASLFLIPEVFPIQTKDPTVLKKKDQGLRRVPGLHRFENEPSIS